MRRSRNNGVPGGALTSAGTPYYIPTQQVPQRVYTPVRKPLVQMNKQESCQHLEDLQTRILAKKKRERDYLDRRANNPRHTPTSTDYLYEQDQILEDELLEMLAFLLSQAEQ
jgi:hypothetical protein